MRKYSVKWCGSGEGVRENLYSAKNQAQALSEEYSCTRQHRPSRRSTYLPFNILLAFTLSTAFVNVGALIATSDNINTMRLSAMTPFSPLQITLNGGGRSCARYILELNSWHQTHPHKKQLKRFGGRLFSHIPKYLDQLTLSNTASTIPGYSASFLASSPHHDAATTLEKESHIAEIIGKSSQNLLHSTLHNAKDTKSVVPPTIKRIENVFSYDLPEGKCVGLRLISQNNSSMNSASLDPIQIRSNENHWIKKLLHADEVQFGIDLPTDYARMSFYVGRLAMRTALSLVYEEGKDSNIGMIRSIFSTDQSLELLPYVPILDPSILKDQYGRPQVPNGFIGSISHKNNVGVALVSAVDDSGALPPTKGVGVDIEQAFSNRKDIAKKVLTKREIENLGKIEGVTRDEEVLLRFSLKECVYKAMHPLICQWVGFQEAEITPHDDGTATVNLNLKSGAQQQFQDVKAHWRRIGGDFFLTSSSVILKK